MKTFGLRAALCLVLLSFVALMLGTCNSGCEDPNDYCHIEELSAHYKKNQDYQSLVSLIPYLDLHDMTRGDVEQLLGEPVYCPVLGQCYYLTEKMIVTPCSQDTLPDGDTCRNPSTGEEIPPQRFPLILVVSYQGNGSMQPLAADPLRGFYLTPVGE